MRNLLIPCFLFLAACGGGDHDTTGTGGTGASPSGASGANGDGQTATDGGAPATGGGAGANGGTLDGSADAAKPPLTQTLPLPGSSSPATLLSVPATISKLGLQKDPYVIAGYLDVTHYGADPTGTKDSTAAFQSAINDAGGDPTGKGGTTMVVFVPPGTYTVSDTLLAVQTYGAKNARYGTIAHYGGMLAPSLVGDPTNRPTLVLKDGSAGFGDPSSPTPIVRVVNTPDAGPSGCGGQWDNATAGCFDILFNAVVRDIAVKTGKNPGAVGVQMYSAQMSYMQNVSVDATGGFAGIEGAPATDAWVNIAVTGGQYGIMVDTAAGANAVAGLTLSGQSVAGVYFERAVGDLAISGFDIEETSATGIVLTDGIAQGTTLSLVDGVIATSSATQPAITNLGGDAMYLENTYLQSKSGTLIANHGSTTVAASGALQLVNEYAHVDQGTNTLNDRSKYALAGTAVSLDDTGAQLAQQTTDVGPTYGTTSPPPTDLVRRHVPRMPWAFDTNAVWVTDRGADPTGKTDSTAAIQKAIELAHTSGSDEVFLPRGSYSLTATLHLHADTKFFGIPGLYAGLSAWGWVTGGKLQPYLQVGDAVNDAAATRAGTAVVSDIAFAMPVDTTQFPEYARLLPADAGAYNPTDQTYLYAMDWQTGAQSVVSQINVAFQYNTLDVPSPATRNYIQVDHDGGGRWYGMQIAGDWGPNTAQGHSLYVTGTSTPLTLYGSNPEHSRGISFYGFDSAANIRVLGLKMESGDNTYLVEITASKNIMLSGFSGHGEFTVAESRSTGLNLNTAMYFTEPGDGDQAFFTDLDTAKSYSFTDAYALLTMGTFDESVFPTCTSGLTCDP
jgi:hypothetical protein